MATINPEETKPLSCPPTPQNPTVACYAYRWLMPGEAMPDRDEKQIVIEQSLAIDTCFGTLQITITGPAIQACEARKLILRCVNAARCRADFEALN